MTKYEDWAKTEVELIVSDYFQMLNAELRGQSYNKAEHTRFLLPLLNNRKRTSVEYKRQNLSAILIKYGMPYISGYKPLYGFQHLLEVEVLAFLQTQKGVYKTFNAFAVEDVSNKPASVKYDKWIEDAPTPLDQKSFKPKIFKPVKRNYLEIEQNNRSIGAIGEELVFDFEKWRLRKAKLSKLAEQVQWVSKDLGDGLGYDILSKDNSGNDTFIEVKTTKLSKESPIFFSSNEYEFAKTKADSFLLYRVFDVKMNPRIFIKNGPFNNICTLLEATNYRGYF